MARVSKPKGKPGRNTKAAGAKGRVPVASLSRLVCCDCGLSRKVRARELARAAVVRCYRCGGKLDYPGLI